MKALRACPSHAPGRQCRKILLLCLRTIFLTHLLNAQMHCLARSKRSKILTLRQPLMSGYRLRLAFSPSLQATFANFDDADAWLKTRAESLESEDRSVPASEFSESDPHRSRFKFTVRKRRNIFVHSFNNLLGSSDMSRFSTAPDRHKKCCKYPD